MRGSWRRTIGALMVVVMASGLAACGDDDDSTAASGGGEASGFADAVKASLKAENAKDADAFLALWTDDGLAEYDSGTREEIASGKSENFGVSTITITKMGEAKLDGNTATVVVDATTDEGEETFATPLFRAVFKGMKDGGDWKINGFEFTGSPPPGPDADVVRVTAREYQFDLDKTTASGEVAFRFINAGKEQHEISLYKAPDGITVDEAKVALQDVDGSELEDIPDGYEVAHVGFAEVGQESDITFAEPLPTGDYVLTCYIPQGGFGENGPVNPEGRAHIQLGMLALLTVK